MFVKYSESNIKEKEIREMLSFLQNDYPSFLNFLNKVFSNSNNYPIIICLEDNELIGCAILDKNKIKISTFFIKEKYRHKGYGTALFEECFKELNTTKPYLYFKEKCFSEYQPFINKFHWEYKLEEGIYYINY